MIAACEKEIPFKSDELDSKIVLYSNLNPDSIISCDIGLSYPVIRDNYSPHQIKDARVRLLIDGEFSEFLEYREPPEFNVGYGIELNLSKYKARQFPEADKIYSIEVELNGMGKVSGNGSLPRQVPIIRVDTQRLLINEYGYTYAKIETKLVFKDPEQSENFYRLNLRQISGFYPGDKYLPYNSEIPVLVTSYPLNWIDSDDPILFPKEEEGLFEATGGNEYLIFNDEKINGEEYELKFNLSFEGMIPNSNYFEFFHYEIQLQSINKELYYYLKSSGEQRYNDGNLFMEPVIVYSNIINGLGVFGTTNSSSSKIEFGDYPVDGIIYEFP